MIINWLPIFLKYNSKNAPKNVNLSILERAWKQQYLIFSISTQSPTIVSIVRVFQGISRIVEDLIRDLNQNPQRSASYVLKASTFEC